MNKKLQEMLDASRDVHIPIPIDERETAEARLVSLKSVFDLDHSVGVLKDMPCGCYAERKTQKDNWIVKKR